MRGHEQLARPLELQRQPGVHDVGGRQPVVDPAPGRPGGRREDVHERRRVVVEDLLALVDRVDREGRRADRVELLRGGAVLQRLRGRDLHVAHRAEARLVGPDGPDLGAGVAGDHKLRMRAASTAAFLRVVHADRRHRHAGRHLGDRQQRVEAARDASSTTSAARRSPAGPCARRPRPGSAAARPAPAMITFSPRMRAFLAYSATMSGSRCARHHADLVEDAAVGELLRGLLHDGHVGLGAHDDADERGVDRQALELGFDFGLGGGFGHAAMSRR